VAIGGYLAIELAAARPDLVAGLVLIGCKPAPDSPGMADAREAVAQLALAAGSVAVADKLVDQPLAPGAGPEVRAALRTLIEAADPRGIAGLVRGLARRPDPVLSLEAVAAAGMPVLVVNGADDPFTTPAQARALAERVPGARYVEIADCGHLPPLEAPDACAAAIAGFLMGLPA
jgi:pimeloyl-ACP methyl ester carboxylesterase